MFKRLELLRVDEEPIQDTNGSTYALRVRDHRDYARSFSNIGLQRYEEIRANHSFLNSISGFQRKMHCGLGKIQI